MYNWWTLTLQSGIGSKSWRTSRRDCRITCLQCELEQSQAKLDKPSNQISTNAVMSVIAGGYRHANCGYCLSHNTKIEVYCLIKNFNFAKFAWHAKIRVLHISWYVLRSRTVRYTLPWRCQLKHFFENFYMFSHLCFSFSLLVAIFFGEHLEEDRPTRTTAHSSTTKVLPKVRKTLDVCRGNRTDLHGPGWVKRNTVECVGAMLCAFRVGEIDERVAQVRSIIASPWKIEEVILPFQRSIVDELH